MKRWFAQMIVDIHDELFPELFPPKGARKAPAKRRKPNRRRKPKKSAKNRD